jgi:hypothetical protein
VLAAYEAALPEEVRRSYLARFQEVRARGRKRVAFG